GRENRPPKTGRAVTGHLEAIAPFVGIGEIAARAIAAVLLEIERRREHEESLEIGKPFEGNSRLLAHEAAAAVGPDQIGAFDGALHAAGPNHNRNAVRTLRRIDNLMAEVDLD